MPKILKVELEVPSGSRPQSMLTWLNKMLEHHRMKVLAVEDPTGRAVIDSSPPIIFSPKFPEGSKVKHLRTENIYKIVHDPSTCRFESTAEGAYAYLATSGPDFCLWVRSQREMEDGRFEASP